MNWRTGCGKPEKIGRWKWSFVVDRLEDLVDEGGSRSASRIHEHDSSHFVSEQNVAIQILKSMPTSINIERSDCVYTTGLSVSSWFASSSKLKFLLSREKRVWDALCEQTTVSPFYRDLHLLPKWSSCFHEKHVDSWERSALSVQTTGLPVLWEARSRPECRGPQRKYAEYSSTTLRRWRCRAGGTAKWSERWWWMRWKCMEKSKRSEATLTARMNHEDDHGMTGDSNLSQASVRTSSKENSQGTMTLTDNKEERDYEKTKDLQCMMTNALASTTLTNFPTVSGHFARSWDVRSALRVTNSIVVAVPLYYLSDLDGISL